jgi:hypothetical protein
VDSNVANDYQLGKKVEEENDGEWSNEESI